MPHFTPKSRLLTASNRRVSLLAKVVTVLAALGLVAALVYLFFSDGSSWQGAQPKGPATLDRVEIKRDFKNGILTLEIEYQNDTATPVNLAPPFTRLLDAESLPAALFTLQENHAAAPIPAGETKIARLRYWLEPDQMAGALRLFVDDQTILLKSPATFDLTAIPNQQSKILRTPDW